MQKRIKMTSAVLYCCLWCCCLWALSLYTEMGLAAFWPVMNQHLFVTVYLKSLFHVPLFLWRPLELFSFQHIF